MPCHKNMHNCNSASYDSRYEKNKRHGNFEDQEEELNDGDESNAEEFNDLFNMSSCVTKERTDYASSFGSLSSNSSEVTCTSVSKILSLISVKPPCQSRNSDNLPTTSRMSLKKYRPKLSPAPNSKAPRGTFLAAADRLGGIAGNRNPFGSRSPPESPL